jgi:ribosomal-protein-alanine N-acetyltransferase
MVNPYAIGKKIYLRAPVEEDVFGNWYQWLSDPEITRYLADRYWPNTKETQLAFFNSSKEDKNRLVLSICDIETDKHIGVCNLSSINWFHKFADVALIVGEKEFRNGAYAVETLSLLIQIAFNRLNLINLRSAHISTNPFTPKLEKMFGFVEAGRLTNFIFSDGIYVDLVLTQLRREDWSKRNKRKTL